MLHSTGLGVLCFVAITVLSGCNDDMDCPGVSYPSLEVSLVDSDGGSVDTAGFSFEYRLEQDGEWELCQFGGNGGPSNQCGYDESGTFSVRAFDDTRFGVQTGIRVTMGECNVRTQNVTLTVTEVSVPE